MEEIRAEDLIRKIDAIDEIRKCSFVVDAIEKIRELPSAKPRPRGKWIKVYGFSTPGGDPVWRCSECGKGLHTYGIEASTYGELIQYANIIQRGFIQEIDNAPTIEPEPSQVARDIATIIENEQDMRVIARERMKGKWIRNDNGTYSCSVCQSWIPKEQHYYARYCLYCGADMRGEE